MLNFACFYAKSKIEFAVVSNQFNSKNFKTVNGKRDYAVLDGKLGFGKFVAE